MTRRRFRRQVGRDAVTAATASFSRTRRRRQAAGRYLRGSFFAEDRRRAAQAIAAEAKGRIVWFGSPGGIASPQHSWARGHGVLGFPLVQQYRQHAADLREVAVALLLRVLVRGEVSVRHEEPRGAELEEYGYCTFIA